MPVTGTGTGLRRFLCPRQGKKGGIGVRGTACTGRKEGNVLFNDALNTFYLWLYGVKHMVKNHSNSEKGNPLPPHRLLFPINSKGSFICTIPQTGLHIPRPLLHQSWSTGWYKGVRAVRPESIAGGGCLFFLS